MRVRALALVVAAAGLAAGCGDRASAPAEVAGEGSGALVWVGEPLSIPGSQSLPDDRIVGGKVRNDSLRPVELRVREMELVDGDGERIRQAALGFIDYYAHGIFPPSRREDLATAQQREDEDRRLGRIITVEAGATVPLTFAWRRPEGTAEAVEIRYPDGVLPIPAVGRSS